MLLLLLLALTTATASAATIATFQTPLGTMQLELFDDQKPITVSNFIKYATSGRFDDMFVQRWEPGFVIQGGGYYVEDRAGTPEMRTIQTFGPIPNEYSVGETYSNTYGTIAMARQAGVVDSASSQWFLNLGDNSFLDSVDEGFTVFGRIISGTNVLNRFIPPPPQQGVYRTGLQGFNTYGEYINVPTLPVLATDATYDDMVYIDLSLRRDLALTVTEVRGRPIVAWQSVAGVTNLVEFRTATAPEWHELTAVIGTGETMTYTDSSATNAARLYRVGLRY